MLFDSWMRLAQLVTATVAAYASLVVALRVSGKRTLAKLNAFDLVVTIALGSVLATVVLSRSVALVEGVAAFALLVALQYVVAASSLRFRSVRRLVKSAPTALVLETDGTFSVISDAGDGSALTGVRPHEPTTDLR